jgi:hypothetical protein
MPDVSKVPDPIRFCRYRSLTGQGAESVRDSILFSKHFFASPSSFNDPFDCRPYFELRGSRGQMLKYHEELIGRYMPQLNRKERRAEAMRRISDPTLDLRAPKNMDGFRRIYHENVTSKVGFFVYQRSMTTYSCGLTTVTAIEVSA